MKKAIYILTFIFIASCNTRSVDTSKPDNIPDSFRWGTYENDAYNDGRMHFNEDSTIMLIVPNRVKHNETSTTLTDTNIVINGE